MRTILRIRSSNSMNQEVTLNTIDNDIQRKVARGMEQVTKITVIEFQ
jgi:hypothetical protein